MGAVLHEVVGPDVVGPAGSQTDAGPVVQPQPAALRLFARNLEPLTPPDTPHPLHIDRPAIGPQKGCHPAVAITAIPLCMADDGLGQSILIIPQDRPIPLGRPVLAKNPARPTLRDLKNITNMAYRGPTACGAQ